MPLLAAILQKTVTNQNIDIEHARRLAMTILAMLPFVVLIVLAIFILPFWFICKKAGLSPWLSTLNIVPFGTLILLYMLAFAEWKVVPAPQVEYVPPPPHPPPPRA